MARNYMQGKFTPKNPQKYGGDPNNIIYRSSWELALMMWMDKNPDIIKYSSEETVVWYTSPLDGRPHRYFPDFVVRLRDRDGKIKTAMLEVKPDKQTRPPKPRKSGRVTKSYLEEQATWSVNDAKWKAARHFCRERGWEFIIITENNLGIK